MRECPLIIQGGFLWGLTRLILEALATHWEAARRDGAMLTIAAVLVFLRSGADGVERSLCHNCTILKGLCSGNP